MLLRDNNPTGIDQPCIKIANSEVLFEKYRMALKRDKDAIEFKGMMQSSVTDYFLISC